MADDAHDADDADDADDAEVHGSAARIELVAAILLGVAATLTAISAFLSSAAGGEQLEAFNTASAKLTDANFFYQQGNQTFASDNQLFVAYLSATQAEQDTGFLTDLMSPVLEASIADWEANDDVFTPFDSDEYSIEEYDTADGLTQESEQALADADDAGARGDKLDLSSVVFATALFAGGIVTGFKRRTLQVALLSVGSVLVVLGAAVMVAGL